MTSEQKADALEAYMEETLDAATALQQGRARKFPTVAEIAEREREAHRHARAAAATCSTPATATDRRAARWPRCRDAADAARVLRAALRARQPRAAERDARAEDRHVRGDHPRLPAARRACSKLIKVDHGWWGAQMFEPYIPEKVDVRDPLSPDAALLSGREAGYEYPEIYLRIFGEDYKPQPYIEATYKMVAQPQVVHGAAAGHGQRSLRVRSERQGVDRSVHRHHRPPLQAAEGRARLRQQPDRAHVADDDVPGSAASALADPPVRASGLSGRWRLVACDASFERLAVAGVTGGGSAGAQTYKGLEVTVSGIERATNVSLEGLSARREHVRGVIKPGEAEEFAAVKVDFKVTPAFKPASAAQAGARPTRRARPTTPRSRSPSRDDAGVLVHFSFRGAEPDPAEDESRSSTVSINLPAATK